MATKTTLDKKTNQEVIHYYSLLKKANIDVVKLIVFGSRAKGTSNTASDIDLCVVSDQFGTNGYDDRVKLMMIRDRDSIDIEPHPYHPDDLLVKWDSLAHEIRTHGIEVKV